MTLSNAIYPGSFDPITYGHIDIVRRAIRLFDSLVIAVVANPRKKPLFSATERVKIAETALAESNISGVKVMGYDGLLINCAKAYNVQAIVRGLRANSDFDYEFQMALTNRDLDSDIETVFFMTAGSYSFLSSSIVKEVKRFGGEIKSFVPKSVEQALAQKFGSLTSNR